MSFVAFRDVVRSMLPGIVADPNNHKNTAVITLVCGDYSLHADRHGWVFSTTQGSLEKKRDASPLGNAQALAVYLENL